MKHLQKNINQIQLRIGLVCLTVVLLFGSSCNKDFQNTLNTSFKNDTAGVSAKERKVLYIIMDGVRGKALRNVNPPNIAQIVKKSIYAYDGLTDFKTNTITNAAAWSSMLTGVTSDKHKVTTENFAANQINNFPSLFTRFKQLNPKLRSVSIASSKVFNDYLAADATSTLNYENDDVRVKDAVIEELKRNEAAIVVAQFHGAEAAGAASGYTDASVNYTNAIKQQDTYVGLILTALQGRENFANEDWLVVIASNKGGTIPPIPNNPDKTVFADDTRNNFVIFYNPRFLTQFIPKPESDKLPYSGAAPNFTGNNSAFNSATIPNSTFANFGTNTEWVVQLKIRFDHASTNYPPFIGKTTDFKNGNAGWVLFSGADNWTFKANGTTQVGGNKVRDGIWHSIAFKIWNQTSSSRRVTLYQDGLVINGAAPLSISGINLDSPAPLSLGHIFSSESNGTIDVMIKDVVIYNVAIPDADILVNMRKTVFNATTPYYSNIIGYWPGNETGGNIIADKSGKAPNFDFNGFKWKTFTDITPNFDPEISDATYKVVPNNVDIPFQILAWMGKSIQPAWQLDGRTWKPLYTDVRL